MKNNLYGENQNQNHLGKKGSKTLAIIRLGSQTTAQSVINKRTDELKKSKLKGKLDYSKMNIVEINPVEGINNSRDKLAMKKCFFQAGTSTSDWWTSSNGVSFISPNNDSIHIDQLPYPVVMKHRFGSRNNGNSLMKNSNELKEALKGKNLASYIFEKYYSYVREYRLHVNKFGCFYTCRKVLKNETPEDKRWFKNDSNSNWILEANELFDKPINFQDIINDCVNTLTYLNLDFAAFDIRVQSANDSKGIKRNNPEYIIIESNSAPSFGDVTLEKYKEMLPKLIIDKMKQ